MARARPGAGGAKVEAAGGRSGPARVRATAGGRRLRRGGRTPVPAPHCAGRTHGRRLGGSAARRLGGSAARRLGGSADIIDRAPSTIVNPLSGLFSGERPGAAAALSPTPYPPVSPLMAVSIRRRRFRPMVHAHVAGDSLASLLHPLHECRPKRNAACRAQTGGRLDGRPARCGIAPVAVAAERGAAGPAATGERAMSGAETVFGVGGAGR